MRIILVLFLFSLFPVFGQRGIIRYSKENGLVSNEVNDVIYDKQGFLWIATNHGIDRFDGQRFIHFKHNPTDAKSISSDLIVKIAFDGDHKIYASARNKGLVTIDTRTFQIQNTTYKPGSKGVSSNKIIAFEHADKGCMWIANAGKGLDFLDPVTNDIRNYRPSKQFPNLNELKANTFCSVSLDKYNKNILWCLSEIGLFSLDIKKNKWSYYKVHAGNLLEKKQISERTNQMRSLVQDGKGNLYIGTSDGSFLYFDQLQKVYRLFQDPFLSELNTPVSGLSWRDARYLYVCAEGKELLLFDSRTKEFIRYEKDERKDIKPFNLVRFGSQIAICSKESGLFLHNEAKIYGSRFSFGQTKLAVTNKNQTEALFYFSEAGELSVRSLSNPFYSLKTIQTNASKVQVFPFGRSAFICRLDNEIQIIWKSGKVENLANFDCTGREIQLIGDDSGIWIHDESQGIFYWDESSKAWQQFVIKGVKSRQLWKTKGKINSLVLLFGRILMAGDEGVFLFDQKTSTFRRFDIADEFLTDEVTAMHLADNEILWFGTRSSGLYGMDLVDSKLRYRFDENSEFPIEEIEEITSDLYGQLWVRTTGSIVRVNEKQSIFDVLTDENGVSETNAILLSKSAVFLVQNGALILSDLKLGMLDPRKPQPYIQRVIVLNNNHSKLNLHLFNASQNNIQFEFGVLDYSNSSNNKVSYRLLGIDDKWQNGNNKDEVSYYNLAGGNYRFEYRVIANGKEYKAFYDFRVLNPFYLRWWFVLLVTVLILFSIWFYIRLRIKRIGTTERMKAQFSADLNEMESKALQAQMNPHFLFNSLNSIRLFVLKNEVDSAANYIAKFSKLLRMILNYSRQDMITVYDEIQSMKLYMDFERLRFDNGFDFDIEINGQDVLDCRIPPLIVQPFIENAIWHGLMPRMDSKGYIHVSFKLDEKALRVTVEDNGIGREKARENSSRRSLKEGSVGLQITKERLKGLSFRTKKQNEVEIIDLFDENNQPKGTLVNLYFEL